MSRERRTTSTMTVLSILSETTLPSRRRRKECILWSAAAGGAAAWLEASGFRGCSAMAYFSPFAVDLGFGFFDVALLAGVGFGFLLEALAAAFTGLLAGSAACVSSTWAAGLGGRVFGFFGAASSADL